MHLARPLRIAALSLREELRSVATSPSSLLVIIGGVILYGLLYNLLYRPNIVRDSPVVVVDNAANHLSRDYIRKLNSTQQVDVRMVVSDFLAARHELISGSVEAIIYLPQDMAQRIGRGEQAIFVTLASTAQLLNYEAVAKATLQSMLALDREIEADLAWELPAELVADFTNRGPINPIGNALYNPTEGYADYLLPPVLILILFQTMVMVISMQQGARRGRGQTLLRGLRPNYCSCAFEILGRVSFYAATYSLLSLFLLALLPRIFDLPHTSNIITTTSYLFPFLIATALFGECFGRFFADSDSPLLFITFFSVGLLFLSGISFPSEQIPGVWRNIAEIFPSTAAIRAHIATSSMGAEVGHISSEIATLWYNAAGYFIVATATCKWRQQR